jgi:peroxiredoxin
MNRPLFALLLVALAAAPATADKIVARSKTEADGARFQAVLAKALTALGTAESYALDVESQWSGLNDPAAPSGASRYRLIAQRGGKYRVEVQSAAAKSPELLCVCDAKNVTTFFPARSLYSQHAVGSPQASIESNTMLALSLQGSAIDIMLQQDVAGFVRTQSSDVHDHGEALLGKVKAHHFELFWSGAKVELWFAAEGEPLLLQFTRTTCVPTGENENYEQVCTAKFNWKLGAKPAADSFVISLPKGARRVNEIYDALSGEEPAARIGKPLPKVQLTRLDGSSLELAAAKDKRATVLIFWATWCTKGGEELAAVSELVKAYKDKGIAFYAVNVGEQPGEVRRFTAKSPLVSTVLLDPHARASSALRVTELPAVVVAGSDNSVRAVLQGSAKVLQGELTEELETILAENPAKASTARLPGEPTK